MLEAAEMVGSLLYNGLKLLVRGNKWHPGWRGPVAIFPGFLLLCCVMQLLAGVQLTAIVLLSSVTEPPPTLSKSTWKEMAEKCKQCLRY